MYESHQHKYPRWRGLSLRQLAGTLEEVRRWRSSDVLPRKEMHQCDLQRGMRYQWVSAEFSICTSAPISGALVHFFSGQYIGTSPPPNFFQCSSQLPQRQASPPWIFMLMTLIHST